jgi:hypothetical protein
MTLDNFSKYKNQDARCKRAFKQKARDGWKPYVSEAVHTNSRTTKISADSDYVRRHIEQGGTSRRALNITAATTRTRT